MSDAYESKYLHAEDALFFERLVARRALLLPVLGALGATTMTLALAMGGDAGIAVAAGAAGVAATTLTMGAIGIFFGVARTVVTKDEIRIDVGMMGPRIPIASVRSVEVAPFTRLGRAGERAVVPSTATECVRVRYEEGGREQTVLLGTCRASALVEAILRAKAGTALAKVRVEAPSDVIDPDLAAAEAEVDAELARADAKSEATEHE